MHMESQLKPSPNGLLKRISTHREATRNVTKNTNLINFVLNLWLILKYFFAQPKRQSKKTHKLIFNPWKSHRGGYMQQKKNVKLSSYDLLIVCKTLLPNQSWKTTMFKMERKKCWFTCDCEGGIFLFDWCDGALSGSGYFAQHFW